MKCGERDMHRYMKYIPIMPNIRLRSNRQKKNSISPADNDHDDDAENGIAEKTVEETGDEKTDKVEDMTDMHTSYGNECDADDIEASVGTENPSFENNQAQF